MKTLLLLLVSIIVPCPVLASEAETLAKVIYQESGGESVRAAALTACSAVNRARKTKGGLTTLVKRGTVKAKSVPKELKPYFVSLARTALTTNSNICKGADSWNRGRKPRWAGRVKGYAGKQVYYAMAR